MRVYAARHFARESAQPWWYEGLLTVPYMQMLEHFIAQDGSPRAILDLAAADFERKVEAAGREDVIVYGTHPCMWVCQTFYDIHNCKRRGHLPAKEKWQPAPLLPADRIGRNRRFFPMFLDYLQGSGVEFITYRQLVQRFDEPSNEWLTRAQLASMARQVVRRFAATQSGGRYYSVAEVLGALCWALARYEDGALPGRVPVRRLLGPVETPRQTIQPLQVCARAVVGAAGKADAHVEANHRLPAGIDVGGHHFTPAQLLLAAAQSYLAILAKGKPCGAVLQPGDDCPQEQNLLEGATIGAYSLPKGYRPERLLEQGRLQSWTLKPATALEGR